MTIDMKNYEGELETQAAVEQPVEQNSYQRNEYEFPVLPPDPVEKSEAPLEAPPQAAEQKPVQEDVQDRNFKALSESVEQIKAKMESERREHQLQLDMLRANLAPRSSHQDAPKAPKVFEGMSDDDIPNVGELKKVFDQRESQYKERIEELQVQTQFPDYADVLTKHGKHLAETDPLFMQGLRGAENKALFAYQYAKREQRLQELEAQVKSSPAPSPLKSNDAQRIVDNARKPGTLAQTGGQGALSKADYFETMSDADFIKYASKHLEGI